MALRQEQVTDGGPDGAVQLGLTEREYDLVRRKVWDLARVDLTHYKSQQMNRRLNALIARSGYASWAQYFHSLEADPAALAKFRSYLTINVTRFFRDAPKWEQLTTSILPELLRERRRLRVWSAGCSNGGEPYTLAMILNELGLRRAGASVLATDIDQGMLAQARAGGPYTADDVDSVSAERLLRYFEVRGGGYWVKQHDLPTVTFRQHDLLNEAFERDFDLIVCRNVVIYFVDEVKRRLYQRFAEALRPGGVLFVGGTETVPTLPGVPLRSMGISFYRKEPTL